MATPTLTLLTDGPGRGALRPVLAAGGRVRKTATYTLTFTGNYVAGGEDISSIWSDFKEVSSIHATCRGATVANMRYAQIDHTNRKIILYTAGATENTAASIAGVSFDLDVNGY